MLARIQTPALVRADVRRRCAPGSATRFLCAAAPSRRREDGIEDERVRVEMVRLGPSLVSEPLLHIRGRSKGGLLCCTQSGSSASPNGDAVCCGYAAQALERARLPPSALLSPYVMNELNGDDRVSRLRAA